MVTWSSMFFHGPAQRCCFLMTEVFLCYVQDLKWMTKCQEALERENCPEKSHSFPYNFGCIFPDTGSEPPLVLVLAQRWDRLISKNSNSNWLSTPEWNCKWASDPRGIFFPPIWSRCLKQPKFTSNSWNPATCLCFLIRQWVRVQFAASQARRIHKSLYGNDLLTLLIEPLQAKMLPVPLS